MAAGPRTRPGTPGRSSAACCSAGTSSPARELRGWWPPPSRRRPTPVRLLGGRAEGRVFLPAAASGRSDTAAATRFVWGW
jgi:hypothetical protein